MAEAQPVADDQTILNDTALWRRIPQIPSHCVYDHNQNRWRPTSAAFKDHPDGSAMSVTIDAGQAPATALANYPGQYLAAITAGLVRSLGQVIVRKPEDQDVHHAEVVGPKQQKKVRNDMAKASIWVIAPPDDSHAEQQ